MSRHLDRTTDWTELARRAGYRTKTLAEFQGCSVRQLERYFFESFGRRPQDWLEELRLMDAVLLLIEGYRVKEAAAKLHFCDVAHFSNRFKNRFGCSPSAFVDIYLERLTTRKRQFQQWFPGEEIPSDWLEDPIVLSGHAILRRQVHPFGAPRSNDYWIEQVTA